MGVARALRVASVWWHEGYQPRLRHWVIADDRETARRFAEEACAYCDEPHDAVLVYHGGCWSKSRSLWREVQAASFEDLVLAGDLAREIREDFGSFLAAREEYARYGVPWKRGVLFVVHAAVATREGAVHSRTLPRRARPALARGTARVGVLDLGRTPPRPCPRPVRGRPP